MTVRYTTERGLLRRARQLADKYSVYGDDWVWHKADIAIASDGDVWVDNHKGGQWCDPANGWLDL